MSEQCKMVLTQQRGLRHAIRRREISLRLCLAGLGVAGLGLALTVAGAPLANGGQPLFGPRFGGGRQPRQGRVCR